MSKGNNSSATFGITFCQLLSLVFITLKLLGIIDWSWWWILAPLWGPFAIAIVVLLILLSVYGFSKFLEETNGTPSKNGSNKAESIDDETKATDCNQAKNVVELLKDGKILNS